MKDPDASSIVPALCAYYKLISQRIDWQDIILRPVSNKTKKKAAGLGMPAKKENGREADVSIGILSLGGLDNGER